jgi:hypothetical protein
MSEPKIIAWLVWAANAKRPVIAHRESEAEAEASLMADYWVGTDKLDEAGLDRLFKELAAWKARFPQYIYRPQDDVVALRFPR